MCCGTGVYEPLAALLRQALELVGDPRLTTSAPVPFGRSEVVLELVSDAGS